MALRLAPVSCFSASKNKVQPVKKEALKSIHIHSESVLRFEWFTGAVNKINGSFLLFGSPWLEIQHDPCFIIIK